MSGPEDVSMTPSEDEVENAPKKGDAVTERSPDPGTDATIIEGPAKGISPPQQEGSEAGIPPAPAEKKESEVTATSAGETSVVEEGPEEEGAPTAPAEKEEGETGPVPSGETSVVEEEPEAGIPPAPAEKEVSEVTATSAEETSVVEEGPEEEGAPTAPAEKEEGETGPVPSGETSVVEEVPEEEGAPTAPPEVPEGETGGDAVTAPRIRPLSEVLSDNEGLFDIVETRVHTREEVVSLLIEKQHRFIKAYSEELEKGINVDPLVIETLEKAMAKRDELNVLVKDLKERRTGLKTRNKALRKEFLEMVGLQEKLKEKLSEITSLNEFIERQEYKLETEGVDLDTERRLMRDIKEAMEKVREATGGHLPGEIDESLGNISEEMRDNFERIEEAHQEMVKLAEESQLHHNSFVEENRKVKDAESRKSFILRRIKLHEEMATFWETQIGNAAAMDRADGERGVDDIKDAMLKALEEMEKENSRGPAKDKGDRRPDKHVGDAHAEDEEAMPEPLPQADLASTEDAPDEGKEGSQGGST